MRIIIAFTLYPIGQQIMAQHCGYDGASILVVHPHAAGDSSVVDGLRITLLDSMNIPFQWNGRAAPPFIRNTDRSAWSARYINHQPQRGEKLLFPFAQDNYILVIPRGMDLSGWHILVQEFDCEWFEKCVMQQLVPLSNSNSYSLCDTYDATVYPNHSGQHPFHPVDITLELR
jgi:hypothetical protein